MLPDRRCSICHDPYAAGTYRFHKTGHSGLPKRAYAGFRLKGSAPAFAARNTEIAALVAAGELTLEEIGHRYGITRERVRQVANREGASRERVPVPARQRTGRRRVCGICGTLVPTGRSRDHYRQTNHAKNVLRPSDLEAIKAVYERGLGYDAIAQVVGIGKMAVKWHVSRMGLRPHGTGKRLSRSAVAELKAELQIIRQFLEQERRVAA